LAQGSRSRPAARRRLSHPGALRVGRPRRPGAGGPAGARASGRRRPAARSVVLLAEGRILKRPTLCEVGDCGRRLAELAVPRRPLTFRRPRSTDHGARRLAWRRARSDRSKLRATPSPFLHRDLARTAPDRYAVEQDTALTLVADRLVYETDAVRRAVRARFSREARPLEPSRPRTPWRRIGWRPLNRRSPRRRRFHLADSPLTNLETRHAGRLRDGPSPAAAPPIGRPTAERTAPHGREASVFKRRGVSSDELNGVFAVRVCYGFPRGTPQRVVRCVVFIEKSECGSRPGRLPYTFVILQGRCFSWLAES
jgi:hypothetical protein